MYLSRDYYSHKDASHITVTLLILDFMCTVNKVKIHSQAVLNNLLMIIIMVVIIGVMIMFLCRLCPQVVMACWLWLRGSLRSSPTAPSSPTMTSVTEECPGSHTISIENTV